MNSVLLTGSSGLLGSSLNVMLSQHYFVKCIKYNEIDKFVDEIDNYDYIFHCAANTNVEGCEANASLSYSSNFNLTKLIVDNINITSKFIYISSCGVYGDSNGLNTENIENDICKPTTIHHNHKLLSENYIINNLENFLICRVGWLYGNKTDWVSARINELMNNKTVFGNISQFGNMSEVNYVSELILNLLHYNEMGIFNVGNKNSYSRFNYLSCISDFMGKEVLGKNKEYFKRLANVPNNESLDVSKLENSLNIEIIDSLDFLNSYLKGLKDIC